MSPRAGGRRVVVVGGGISGLSTAYALHGHADVTLLEASPRLGGNIVTVEDAGFTLDGGPDSWVNTKPAAIELVRKLGIEDETLVTEEASRKVYVYSDKQLLPMPEGLALGVPTRFLPIALTPLFTWDSKLRMALEPLIPPRQESTDESIGEFFSRRLGDEVTNKLIGPMLGGIYAGDAWELSMQATFPQFVEAERKYGSLVKTMRAMRKPTAPGQKPPSAFTSLRTGMTRLVQALASTLEPQVAMHAPARVVSLTRAAAKGWVVVVEGGSRFEADDVVFAGPAHVLGGLSGAFAPELASALAAIRYTSTATVFFALRREEVPHPLDGVGYIVPKAERKATMASTWVSSKWAFRAPPEHVLVRSFFGGAGREDLLALDDHALVDLAAREITEMMGFAPRPVFTKVFRFTNASPQPMVGHLGRVARIRGELAKYPGLYATGSGFAIGIPDCIKMAQETAKAVLARPL